MLRSQARARTRTAATPANGAARGSGEPNTGARGAGASRIGACRAGRPAPSLTFALDGRTAQPQTVVRERVVPRTVITERTVVPGAFGDQRVVREQIITEWGAAPRRTFGAAPFVTAPAGVERVVTTDVDGDLTVGSRIPATAAIYAVPETLAGRFLRFSPTGIRSSTTGCC